MAYFRKLSSGRWRAEVEVAGQRETQGGFPTKREAQEWAAHTEADLRAGRLGKWPAKTLAQAIERYEREVTPTKAAQKIETGTFDRLRRDYPALVARRLLDVKPEHLAEWMRSRLETVKGSTVLREVNILRNVWRVAAREWRWVPMESPWSFVRLPADAPPRDRLIGWREARAILRALGYVTGKQPTTKSQETAWALMLALRTAMRSGEILGLDADRVNLQTRVIRLDVHKTVRFTGRPRLVPITRQAARLLAVLSAGRAGALFTVSHQSRDALFRKALEQRQMKGFTFHDARATALTHMARRVDVLTLQKISGHADVGLLARVYYRESAEDVAARI